MQPTSLPPALRKSHSFEEIREIVNRESSLWNMDQVIPVSSLKATPRGDIEVPTFGSMALTPWARKQLASHLGIKWDKWFETASGHEAAEEINRRLSRMSARWKIRTRRPRPNEKNGHDGLLCALVSPTYTPIADRQVLGSMERTLHTEILDNFRFTRNAFTDRSFHLSVVNAEPLEVRIGDARETYYAGFFVRNSQVGYTALSIHVYFLRLACINGMLVCEGRFRLLYRTHRPIADQALDFLMDQAFAAIHLRWDEGLAFLQTARTQPVEDADAELDAIFKKTPALNPFRQQILDAFRFEYLGDNRFNLIQAMTSVARTIPEPDTRFELERLAGRILLPQQTTTTSA